jgi:hypothetical protein
MSGIFRAIFFNKTVWLFLFVASFICACRTTNVSTDKKGMDSLVIEYDTTDVNAPLFNRHNKDSVYMSFWGDYDDTVLLSLNGTVHNRILIDSDNYPNRRRNYNGPLNGYQYLDFTGVRDSLYCRKRVNVVKLKLSINGGFIQFILDKRFPICQIKRSNGLWKVSYRKNQETISFIHLHK